MLIEDEFIDRFCSCSLTLHELLRTTDTSHSPSLRALALIEECLAGHRLAKDAIVAAKAVSIDDTSPALLTILLSSWAELACRIGQQSEALALIHRSESLLSGTSRPEVRAMLLLARGIVAGYRGYHSQQEHLLKQKRA